MVQSLLLLSLMWLQDATTGVFWRDTTIPVAYNTVLSVTLLPSFSGNTALTLISWEGLGALETKNHKTEPSTQLLGC